MLSAWGYSIDAPPADGARLLDGEVLHRLKPAVRLASDAPREVPDREPAAVAAYEAAATRFRELAAAPFLSPSSLDEEQEQRRLARESDAVPRGLARTRDLAKAAGIVVHRALQVWNDGPDALRADLERLAREVAAAESLDAEEVAAGAAEVLEAFLGSPLAPMFRRVDKLGREIPLLLRREGSAAVFRGSIDLLYRDGKQVVVADYKTVARYRGQLEVYAEAVRARFGLLFAPRAELWLLREGRRIELPSRDGS
jgi:ATP-dependent exoDNAse (exonuclease V) beta subunit